MALWRCVPPVTTHNAAPATLPLSMDAFFLLSTVLHGASLFSGNTRGQFLVPAAILDHCYSGCDCLLGRAWGVDFPHSVLWSRCFSAAFKPPSLSTFSGLCWIFSLAGLRKRRATRTTYSSCYSSETPLAEDGCFSVSASRYFSSLPALLAQSALKR